MTVDAVLVGAGQRGRFVYGAWALRFPHRLRFVAVADPDPRRRRRFGDDHHIPPSRRFADADELFSHGRIATAAVIATDDRTHLRAATAALEAGYEVLVEKPAAHHLDGVVELARVAAAAEGNLHVAHVLRFTTFFLTLHRLVTSGSIGEVVTVEHRENVASWHMAHSFVRGNWGRAAEATPMIVQKACHDFDILTWNVPDPVVRLSSMGSLLEFRPERAPGGATERCTDPCPVVDCPYDARRIYLGTDATGWPHHVLGDDLTPQGRRIALRTGPYGRCVYRADSDVVDHQVVTMETASGATMVLCMHGHSAEEARTMRYDGTKGTLRAVFGRSQEIEVTDHRTGALRRVPVDAGTGGHGGGDDGLVAAFVGAAAEGRPSPVDLSVIIESHLLAFLAEEARITGTTIDVADRRAALVERLR